jgi:hypothetical protein
MSLIVKPHNLIYYLFYLFRAQIQLSIAIMDPKIAYVCNCLMFVYVAPSISLPL